MLQWMPWQDAAGVAGATAATWAATDRSPRIWARRLLPWARELTITLILYALWQYAGEWSLGRVSSAMSRGRQIWDLERTLHLPSERSAQQLVIHHPLVVHWLNEYYVQVHVPALGILLIWLFVRHRDRYPKVRNVVAMVTGACLLIQLFPVAPPRLLPHIGIVDTGALIGPSTYAGGAPGIDQLSAMPSMHVAWALIVGGAVVWVAKSRFRWLALLYPVATVVVVVLTGNHYWADGIAAAALCFLAAQIVLKAPPIWTGRRVTAAPAATAPLEPALVAMESAPPPDRPATVPTRNVPTSTLPTGTLNRARPRPSIQTRKEPVPLRDSS